MKPTKYRKCFICKELKRTTNLDEPYIGEECYKSLGRDLLLKPPAMETDMPSPSKGAYVWSVILLVVAFLLGKYVF